MNTDNKLIKFSEMLYEADAKKNPVDAISTIDDSLDTDDAYKIQLNNINRKVQEGKKIVGKKIGLTSKAMQDMFNVNQPDYGHLLDDMIVEDHIIQCESMLQPKVEAEIAFVLKEDLIGPGINPVDVLRATDYVMASFEIVDSRIKNWKIGLVDTVADNASSGVFVLGSKKMKVDTLDLKQVKMELYKNGTFVNSGTGSAALGDPAYCVAWLANKMSEYGVFLKKGEVILSGALSAAITAEKGDYFKAEFSELGSVSVQFK